MCKQVVQYLCFCRSLTSIILRNRAPIEEKSIQIILIMKNTVNSTVHTLCGDVLKWRLVSYGIVSCQCRGLLGHFMWLTGKCVQLNWSSILLDGIKRVVYRGSRRVKPSSWEARRVWWPSTRAGTLSKDISIAFIYLLSYYLFHICFINSYDV